MNDPIMHPKTLSALQSVIKRQTHATLISGPDGSGKAYLALYLAKNLLGITKLANYPYFLHITPEKHTITIDSIRQVQSASQLKTTGKSTIRRVIFIEDAHYMGREAQNAFLKLLEEPPVDTCIIMTSDSKDKLLPTILSRVALIKLTPPIKQQIVSFYTKNGFKKDKIERDYFISSGRIGLLDALLNNDEQHQLIKSIDDAKSILGMSSFERLIFVSNIDSKTFHANEFIDGLVAVSKAALEQAIEKEDETSTKRWLHINKLANKYAHDFDRSNPNTTLAMTDLVLSL